MANEVGLTFDNLSIGTNYKIIGAKTIGSLNYSGDMYKCPKVNYSLDCSYVGTHNYVGYFVRYNTDGSLTLRADNNVNVLPGGTNETEPERFLYKQVPPSMISDYVSARQALLSW